MSLKVVTHDFQAFGVFVPFELTILAILSPSFGQKRSAKKRHQTIPKVQLLILFESQGRGGRSRAVGAEVWVIWWCFPWRAAELEHYRVYQIGHVEQDAGQLNQPWWWL